MGRRSGGGQAEGGADEPVSRMWRIKGKRGGHTVIEGGLNESKQQGRRQAEATVPEGLYLCPNLRTNHSLTPAFTALGWDMWSLNRQRDLVVEVCTDVPISGDDCKDLDNIPDDKFRLICNKAMPPTYESTFEFRVPVNNKWKAPHSILQRNGPEVVNRPEFEFDFSLVYHLQYSSASVKVDDEFSTNVDQGDFTDEDQFRIYSGAVDFMGKGRGRDGYANLQKILPANHPVLSNSIDLGVDTDFALSDILRARNVTGGKAANMWPQTEQELKLKLEKFSPLRIEWELSSIGGRSDDNVIVLQPGFEYLLEALVQIRPIYSSNIWELGKIERWERQVVSTAATKSPLTDTKRLHQVIARYNILFDPLVQAQTFRSDYTVLNFAHAVGAAVGYLILGMVILSLSARIKELIRANFIRGKSDAAAPLTSPVEVEYKS